MGIGVLGKGLKQRKGESFVGFSMEMKKNRETESQKVRALLLDVAERQKGYIKWFSSS